MDGVGPARGAALLCIATLCVAGCGLGPAKTTPVADVTATVFVLELSLPEGLSRAEAEAAETRALQREAAELALKVTETKVALGLVEQTRWSRGTVTLTEEGFQGLARRGARVAPGTEIRRSTSRGTGPNGQPVETHSYTVTVESPAGRYEVAGRPRAEAEKFWAPALKEQRAALAALPPPEPRRPSGRLEVRERWRYVAVSPPVPQLEEIRLYTNTRNGLPCFACINEAQNHHALYLRSLGAAGADSATLQDGALDAGIEIEGPAVFGHAGDPDRERVERPSDGRLTLRRVAGCPARIVRVEDTLVVDKGSGVIAVPHWESQTWHELRDAACIGTGDPEHEVFGPSQPMPPDTARNPSRFWIEEHRAELARLERREWKQPPP